MTRRTLIPAVAAVLVILGAAAPQAQHPHRDRGPAHALARAADLYARGDLGAALQLADRARAAIADELGGGPRRGGLARSNADALLGYLDWYWACAGGRDPQLDLEARFLSEHLEMIRLLECGPDRPTRLGDLDVGTWADGKVHRIGRVDVR